MHLRSADTLRALTKQEGLSYRDIADSAGCSWSFIGHLVAGRRNCTPELAARIAEVLAVPVETLFAQPSSAVSGSSPRQLQTIA